MINSIRNSNPFWCSVANQELVCSTPLIVTISLLAFGALAVVAYSIKTLTERPGQEIQEEPSTFSKILEGVFISTVVSVGSALLISAGSAILAKFLAPPVAVAGAGYGIYRGIRVLSGR